MNLSAVNECVFLQITSSYPDLFKNVHKNLNYLNQILTLQVNGMFYLETIYNGILYVYKNVDFFILLNTSLSARNVKELKAMDRIGSAMFLENVLTSEKFPAEGIIVYYQLFTNTNQDLASILVNYFLSYNERGIQPKQISPHKLEVLFSTFEGLTLYTQRLGKLLESVVKMGKIPIGTEK